MPKKYALFAGFRHRRGGWEDLIGRFDSIEEAKEEFYKGPYHGDTTGPYKGGNANTKGLYTWVQIVDLDTGIQQWDTEFPENYRDQKRSQNA